MTIISALPFTLENGNEADASQVMADLNQIRNDVNSNIPTTLADYVVGPAGPVVSGHLVVFDGVTGKLVADGGAVPAGSGTLTLLDSQAATGLASIDFTSVLNAATYSGYLIVVEGLLTTVDANLELRASDDNGSTWAVNLLTKEVVTVMGDNSSPTYGGAFPVTSCTIGAMSALIAAQGEIAIVSTPAGSLAITSKVIGKSGTSVLDLFESSAGSVTTANALQLNITAGAATAGNAYLYGISRT